MVHSGGEIIEGRGPQTKTSGPMTKTEDGRLVAIKRPLNLE